MPAGKAWYLAVAMSALLVPKLVFGACSHQTAIHNDSNVTLRFVELKSSYAAPFFKSQWKGTRVIAPGATGTIAWTSDLNCTDASGAPNTFDIKLVRQIGTTHYCGHLGPSQSVTVQAPDLCFPQ
jgi:hypothetical protein